MLVIGRRVGMGVDLDAITIKHPDGAVVAVRVLEVGKNGYVKLGIVAPRSVAVERPDMKRVPALGAMLARTAEDRLHEEVDFGPPQGAERL